MIFKRSSKFVGTLSNQHKSKMIICGIPYDVTSTFRHGAHKAPDSIRYYSDSIETFSPYQNKDLMDFNILDAGDMIFGKKAPQDAIKTIEKYAEYFIKQDKKVLYIGGEHLVSLPVVKKYYEKYRNLKVIYFDAHADMRQDYEGNRLSHSTVARRIIELIGEKNIFMFGIRSFEKEEFDFIKNKKVFCKNSLKKFKTIINKVKNYPVYISLDLDVFDPACFPGVGNPEAGGIYHEDFMELLPCLFYIKNNIVSLDVVELMPEYDLSGNSSVFAAKIIRELLLSIA